MSCEPVEKAGCLGGTLAAMIWIGVVFTVTLMACSPEPEQREPPPVCSLAAPLVVDTTPRVEVEMAREPCPFMSHQPCSADECPGNPDGEVVSWRRVR